MHEQEEVLGCSLSTPELADRRVAWTDLEPLVVERTRTAEGFRLRFRRERGVSESLRFLVEAERDCCSWAAWELADEEAYSVLQVTGPPGNIAGLAAAFGL
ncbi:MAG: hypothetical protein M3072_02145 [Candidatus Dormibacteraeota bacterium]|nr:hypothetical protein [Candidatus Dormibacteraeota bacterium]